MKKTEAEVDRRLIRLEGSLGIADMSTVWQQLAPLLESNTAFALDLTDINHCDAAGIQLLCALHQAGQADANRSVQITISDAIRTVAGQTGIDPQLFPFAH